MLREPIGLHVVLVKATHTVHFVMDAAGDVLNILHMGSVESTRRNHYTHTRTQKEQT